MEQDENLKILYEATDKFYQEMTFKMPDRITNKAFKWLAVYTIALGSLPFFVESIWNYYQKYLGLCQHSTDAIIILILSALVIGSFAVSIILMLIVVHVVRLDAFGYEEPLEEVINNEKFPTGALLIALCKKLQEASKSNRERSGWRSKRMMNSYIIFYVAVSTGLILYLISLT